MTRRSSGHHRLVPPVLGLAALVLWATVGGISATAATTIGLGSAGYFAVLGGSSVTNTGPTVVSGGDVGVSPGSSITGFTGPPSGTVTPPFSIQATTGLAATAQSNLTTAYDQAAGAGAGTSESSIGTATLLPGIYTASSALLLTGALTLNAQGNPNAVFIFQVASQLTAQTGSSVQVINGGPASACNVFWQVATSATLDGPTFTGTVMALQGITLGSGVAVTGRLLARTAGDVTLINDTINASACPSPTSTTPGTSTPITGAFGVTPNGFPVLFLALTLFTAGILATSASFWLGRRGERTQRSESAED